MLLAHPGGPYWAKKDEGAWSIPKGEFDPDAEAPLDAACREFAEELGAPAPPGPFLDLEDVRQKGGKVVRCFAAAGEFNADSLASNTFEMQWPPKSGKMQAFPEIDRVGWFPINGDARKKLLEAQLAFLDRLLEHLDV